MHYFSFSQNSGIIAHGAREIASSITAGEYYYILHTMSELTLIIKKGTKSFDTSEFFFMHWTKLLPKNWTVLASPSWDNAKSPPTVSAQISPFLYSDKEWYRPALKKDSPKQLNSLEII